jgi:acyl-coenzyme A synthetase/AMP-(fatty) acid ligase
MMPGASGTGLPLLAQRTPPTPFAWHHGQAIGTARFLADARALAQQLPAGAAVINLCADRYAFTVAFAAALLAGRTSLLPPNARPETLQQLQGEHPLLCAVSDEPGQALTGLAVLQVPRAEAALLAGEPAGEPGGEGAAAAIPTVPAELCAACLLTSGSTGVPQPHRRSWREMHLNLTGATARLAGLLERPSVQGLSLVATVPPQHSYGLESSVLLALLGGVAIDSGRPFYPADIAAALAAVPRPRALVTTPFHLKALLSAGLALPPVDLVLSATAPLSPQLARQAEAALGGPLIEIYGCTEAGQVASRRTVATEVWHTFGEMRIHREAVAAEAAGDPDERFIVTGGQVSQPTPLADLLRLVDGSHFRLDGRANDLIHVAGRRSSLGHLNYHLNSLTGVQDGAFWLPDEVPDGVVRPVAFVVAPDLSAAQIIAGLRQRLEPVFVPRRVVHVEALPREATGKLGSQVLRRFALEQLGGRSGR